MRKIRNCARVLAAWALVQFVVVAFVGFERATLVLWLSAIPLLFAEVWYLYGTDE